VLLSRRTRELGQLTKMKKMIIYHLIYVVEYLVRVKSAKGFFFERFEMTSLCRVCDYETGEFIFGFFTAFVELETVCLPIGGRSHRYTRLHSWRHYYSDVA